MARAADRAGIQWRTHQREQGPAVRATRAQADGPVTGGDPRWSRRSRTSPCPAGVDDILIDGDRVRGAVTQSGRRFEAPARGAHRATFLAGRIHVGLSSHPGGRAGDPPATRLAERPARRPVHRRPPQDRHAAAPGRPHHPTTRPRRAAGRHADPHLRYIGQASEHPRQVWATSPTPASGTHEIIRGGLDRSPMYSGVSRASARATARASRTVCALRRPRRRTSSHRAEGRTLRGVSERHLDVAAVRRAARAGGSIRGFEQAHITRRLRHRIRLLRSARVKARWRRKAVAGLYLPGRSTAHGLRGSRGARACSPASNAARHAQGPEGWAPRRDQPTWACWVDDLITHGAPEPYRMFTSRRRIPRQLREDNADARRRPVGRESGWSDEAALVGVSAQGRRGRASARACARCGSHPATNSRAARQHSGVAIMREAPRTTCCAVPSSTTTVDRRAGFGPAVADGRVANRSRSKRATPVTSRASTTRRQAAPPHEDTEIPADFVFAGLSGLSAELQASSRRCGRRPSARRSAFPG